jgi:thioesterase domain-containing protein
MAHRCEALQEIWHRTIPISAAMEVEVVELASGVLTVRAALAPNVNVHGTAFAGSLYSICVLTGWGFCWLELDARGLDAQIVVADARIEYLRPVRGEIVCRCAPDRNELAAELQPLATSGRAAIELDCAITDRQRPAVRFSARYVLQRGR